jgi:AbrB family looped-hinge helix DNA binding protein
MSSISSVSSKGQIAIPLAIRKKLKINAGDKVFYGVEDDRFFVKKLELVDEEWLKAVGSTLDEWNNPEDDDL